MTRAADNPMTPLGAVSGKLDSQEAALENTQTDAEQPFLPLDARNIKMEQISNGIFLAIVTLGIIVGLAILGFVMFFSKLWMILLAVIAIGIALGWIFLMLWPVWSHRHASWRWDSEGLEIRRGVLWRHRILIPMGRVQHADVSQGPLQRMHELATLIVHTAGTHNASTRLEGLAHQQAIQLRDQIVHQKQNKYAV